MTIQENIKLEIPEETGKEFLTKLMGGRLKSYGCIVKTRKIIY